MTFTRSAILSTSTAVSQTSWRARIIDLLPILAFFIVVGTFSLLSSQFLTFANAANVLVHSSAIAILAIGMTFVMLSGGIDLSVGSVMFLGGALCGTVMSRTGWSSAAGLMLLPLLGLICGLLNGWCVSRLKMAPFIVTLSMLFIARGIGLWISQTRAIVLPEPTQILAVGRWFGIPLPILILGSTVVLAQLVLSRTSFGRQLYAVGQDREGAIKAGIHVDLLLLMVYVISGLAAGVAGGLVLSKLGAVDPKLGTGRELDAIAAAVLGGASLFGGRGTAIGSMLGAIFIETVRNGMNLVNADPYVYPVVLGGIIFLAVLLDSLRHQARARRLRRVIRPVAAAPSALEGLSA